MQRANFKLSSVILISILLGIAIHFTNPATALIVIILWLAAATSSFVVIIRGLFSRKIKLLYFIGFLPFLVGYGLETGIRKYKHEKAVKLNIQIERYRIAHGRFPDNLVSLNSTVKLSGLTYTPNSDYTNYRIEYLMDQFNREYFESKSKRWGTLGWND